MERRGSEGWNWTNGVGVNKAPGINFSVRDIFPVVWKRICWILWITFIFDRCLCSIAAETLVKYEWYITGKQCFFIFSEKIEKISNPHPKSLWKPAGLLVVDSPLGWTTISYLNSLIINGGIYFQTFAFLIHWSLDSMSPKPMITHISDAYLALPGHNVLIEWYLWSIAMDHMSWWLKINAFVLVYVCGNYIVHSLLKA